MDSDPLHDKAGHALQWHAQRYVRTGLVASIEDFSQRFGWTVPAMARDIRHAQADACPYCGEAFAGMRRGLAAIRIDITDASCEPFYAFNTKWICASCSGVKRRTPPQQWLAMLGIKPGVGTLRDRPAGVI